MQDFLLVTLISRSDEITNCRYYPSKGSKKGVIFVGGIGGDFDTPAKNLYPKLAAKLSNEGISALRIQFRYPTDFEESVQDVLAGAKFLLREEVSALGIVGHSFGGAVVIKAGATLGSVKTVITLATQGFGADAATRLAPHASILLIHGAEDEIMLPENSRLVYRIARGHKQLEILEGNRHGLNESADQVFTLVYVWLKEELKE